MTGDEPGLRKRLPRYALALAIGFVSALAARAIMLPMPWMLGPMIGTMVAAVFGAPVLSPAALRPFVVPVLGVMLGSGFNASMFAGIGSWLLTLALMPAYIFCAAGVAYVYLRRSVGYDPVTAFFCAMPGGLNEMLLMGQRAGGDDRKIALSHATRILIVIMTVVLSYALMLGVTVGNSRPYVGFAAFGAADFGLLAACGIVGAAAATIARMPAALLTGPLILSAIAHSTGLVQLPPPTAASWAAQLVVGTVVGCRFVGVSVREIGRYLVVGFGASVLILTVSALFAGLVAALTATELSQSFLAFSPGGATEMSLLALAMGQEIVYISFSHIMRLAMVVALAPFGFRLFGRIAG